MKIINIKQDIFLICKEASNFPDGIPETFKALENELSNISDRKCYGIYTETGKLINYRAAFSKLNTDKTKENQDLFLIKKGDYLSITIIEWFNKIETIGPTFCKLFEDERIDKNSASIEAYEGNELICMVKMKE